MAFSVCYDFGGAARFLIEEQFGVRVPAGDAWDFMEQWLLANVGNRQAWKWLWKDNGGLSRGLFRHGNVVRGALSAVRRMAKHADVYAITKRPSRLAVMRDTFAWLGHHGFPLKSLYFVSNGEAKSEVQPRCDMYIDDSNDNVVDLILNTDAEVALFSQPWNSEKEVRARISHLNVRRWAAWERTSDWDRIVEIAKGLK